MPAAIFNGSYVKVLKDEIKSKSGGLFDKVYVSAKSTAFTAAVGFTYLINTGTAINRADSATIDGATSQTISSNYGSMKLISDGTNWFIT